MMTVNTDYDKWYLQNLTNTQNIQKTHSTNAYSRTVEKKPETEPGRFDTFELTDDFSDELQKRVIEKTRASREEPQNESTENIVEDEKRPNDITRFLKNETGNDGEKEFPKVEYTGAGAAAKNIGLIDLIDSGKITRPEPKKEDIKPVDRGNSDNRSANGVNTSNTPELKRSEAPSSAPKIEIDFSRYEERDSVPELEPSSRKPEPIKEKIEESATLNTSDELEQKQNVSRVTPAQQQVIQAYQRVQSYTNPVNMSMNMAYSVA